MYYEASRVLVLTTLLIATGIAQRVNKKKLKRSDAEHAHAVR